MIYIATRNRGKVADFQLLLAEFGVRRAPDDVVFTEEVGDTFEENALAKARMCFLQTGQPSIGDDSGLVVPYLDGAPGLRSARYAGEGATDGENVTKLLNAMEFAPTDEFAAYFHTVLAYVDEDREIASHGRVWGTIVEPRGDGGFGYDPVFVPNEANFHGMTYAQMLPAQKAVTSHRARAAYHLKNALNGR